MRPWIYLFTAIICEVLSTASIKYSITHAPILGYLLMYMMIIISYYFLALAVRKVPLGTAYALWEGIGIMLITLISIACFGEHLNSYKIIGLGLMIVGIILIKTNTLTGKLPTSQPQGA